MTHPTRWRGRGSYTFPVLFSPYTGEPRDARDIASDPQGLLIVQPGAPLVPAAPTPPAQDDECAPDPWHAAIDNELVCCHILNESNHNDPRKALQDIINWHVQVALDPAVSSDAQKLIERGQQQARKGTYSDIMSDGGMDPRAAFDTKQLRELPKINAVFETESGGAVGRTSAPVKRVEPEDDGSYSVVINYWPTPPAQPVSNADELERLRAELETERMRLAACGVVALANTPESASEARAMLPEYRSASLDDVKRAVDEQMRLRAELAEAKRDAEHLRSESVTLAGILRDCDAVLVTIEPESTTESDSMADLRRAIAYALDPYGNTDNLPGIEPRRRIVFACPVCAASLERTP